MLLLLLVSVPLPLTFNPVLFPIDRTPPADTVPELLKADVVIEAPALPERIVPD